MAEVQERNIDPDVLMKTPLASFQDSETPDLFNKARRFYDFKTQVEAVGFYQVLYRIQLTSPLDHRITVVDPFTGGDKEMICFDSNSYLGLHLHPRVNEAVRTAVDAMGYGTASAQVLGGTNRYLLELEEIVAAAHDREACLVFPSGYQANVGILTGLLRPGDLVAADEYSHASLQDGCRYSRATFKRYRHRDMDDLALILDQHAARARGVLVASDGVFSMHGDLAPLPQMRELCDRHGARLYIDDAHGTGVIGATGKGVEEHFGLQGSADVMMGTFSKAPGAAGGYVCSDPEIVDYLRFFSHGALFTAALPAHTCAGVAEAFRVMNDEPWHRRRLRENTQRMWQGLRSVGLELGELASPILAVQVGDENKLPPLAVELFTAGIKAGMGQYPAVPKGESILRFTMNARHTEEDIDRTIEVLADLGERHGLLGEGT
jgi:glycine C-acetyltransferase